MFANQKNVSCNFAGLSLACSACFFGIAHDPWLQDQEPTKKDVKIPEPVRTEDPDLDFDILLIYYIVVSIF